MTSPRDVAAGETAPAPARRRRSRIGLACKILGTVLLALLTGLLADAATLNARIDRIPVKATAAVSSTTSQTWLIVGVDDKPADNPVDRPDVIGRADVIIAIQVPDDGGPARLLSIPRDLTVRFDADGHMRRLTLRLYDGVDALAGALCEGIGMPSEHVVLLDMAGLVQLVDAVGGIWLDIEYPTKDGTLLDLPTVGRQLVPGDQVLGLVRARHAERYIDGEWVTMGEAEGNAQRARYAAQVVDAFSQRVRQVMWNPVTLQKLALAATDALTFDQSTSVADILRLATKLGSDMEVLPVEPVDMEVLAWTSLINDETLAVLESYNFFPGGGCVQAE
jgi:hypothetical protein